MEDSDIEQRRGPSFVLLALPFFLPSVISSFFTQNKNGGGGGGAGPPASSPRSATGNTWGGGHGHKPTIKRAQIVSKSYINFCTTFGQNAQKNVPPWLTNYKFF